MKSQRHLHIAAKTQNPLDKILKALTGIKNESSMKNAPIPVEMENPEEKEISFLELVARVYRDKYPNKYRYKDFMSMHEHLKNSALKINAYEEDWKIGSADIGDWIAQTDEVEVKPKMPFEFKYYLEFKDLFDRNVQGQIEEYIKNKQLMEESGDGIVEGTIKEASGLVKAVKEAPVLSSDAFTVKSMLAASLHLGHRAREMHPNMGFFIHGERNGIHIIDLEKTFVCLRRACSAIRQFAEKGAVILFVGSSPITNHLAYDAAVRSGQYYVNVPWVQGVLVNRALVLKETKYLPDLIVVLDIKKDSNAVKEANALTIPVISIVDTDQDPLSVTYPIPANDDAEVSVAFISNILSMAAKEGAEIFSRRNE